MKRFFSEYSYSCVRIFITQCAISIYGFAMTLVAAALGEGNEWMEYVSSGFSILFYLVLIYSLPWNHGAKDRVSADYGKIQYNALTGLYIGLLANIPNFLLALLITVGQLAGFTGFAQICIAIDMWLQGMYMGISTIKIAGMTLNSYWWAYFLFTVPAIVTSTLAYIAGFNNFRVFKFPERRKRY